MLLSLLMMATCVSAAPAATENEPETGGAQVLPWADSIDEMLEGRQYTEGEVIVIYNSALSPEISLMEEGEASDTGSYTWQDILHL